MIGQGVNHASLHNIPAFSVWKNYTANVTNLRGSMSKLSSGLRINFAGDDPARVGHERTSSRAIPQYGRGRDERREQDQLPADGGCLAAKDSRYPGPHGRTGHHGQRRHQEPGRPRQFQREFEQMQKEVQRITSGSTAAGKFNGLYLFRGGNGVAAMTGDAIELASAPCNCRSARTRT